MEIITFDSQIRQKKIKNIKRIIKSKDFDINDVTHIDGKLNSVIFYSIENDLGSEFIKYLISKGAKIKYTLRANIEMITQTENYMEYLKTIFNSSNIYTVIKNDNLFHESEFEIIKNVDIYFRSIATKERGHVLWKKRSIIVDYINDLIDSGNLFENTLLDTPGKERILVTIPEILHYMKHTGYTINKPNRHGGSIGEIITFIIENERCCLSLCKKIIYILLDSGVKCLLTSTIGRKIVSINDHFAKYDDSEPFWDDLEDEYFYAKKMKVYFAIDTTNKRHLFIKDLCENLEKRRRTYSKRLYNYNMFDLNIHYDTSNKKRKIFE